jgi:hypothetical protein
LKSGFIFLEIYLLFVVSCGGRSVLPTSTPILAQATPSTEMRSPTANPPTLTATPTEGPQGLCANILTPLLPGYRWVYTLSGSTNPVTKEINVVAVTQNANIVAHLRVLDHTNGNVFEDDAICDDGAIRNFPLIFIGLLLSDYFHEDMNIYHISGVYTPASAMLVENNWSYSWDLVEMLENQITVSQSVIPNSMYLTKNRNITVHSQMLADREFINVPVGTFPQSIKILQEVKLPVSMWTDSSSLSGEFFLQTTQWYEPYVGLLKAQVDSASISLLEGQNLPIPLNTMIILNEFQPVK